MGGNAKIAVCVAILARNWTGSKSSLGLSHCDSMRTPTLFYPRVWMLVIACVCGFLIWIGVLRIRHLDYISNAAGTPVAMDVSSPTGYAGAVRQFIAPSRGTDSYQWIAQTQQMFSRGEWRVRQVDYDNVPLGRAVVSASLYRWWLAALAGIDHVMTGVPFGVAVERAALFADPLLQLLLVVGTAIFVAWRFGAWPAVLISIGLAATFPFAGSFVPGQPQQIGLQLAVALWSVLPLLIVGAKPSSDRSVRRHFLAGGVIGGIGLWLGVGSELPILVGVIAGGLLAARLAQPTGAPVLLPWRTWALGGAAACLVAYVIEFLPANDPGLRLDVIHPLHGLAWLGLGELLARADRRLRVGKQPRSRRDFAVAALAVIAVVVPLVLALRARHEWFAPDPAALRLSALIDSAIAENLAALISRNGFSAMVVATLLPLVLIVPAVWLVVRSSEVRVRSAVAIAVGPVVVALVLAYFQLRWWALLDAMLLALAVAGAASMGETTRHPLGRWLWLAGIALAVIPGARLLVPQRSTIEAVNESELESLIERDLAHWLANRAGAGRAAILASPHLAGSLAFEGGVRALGSPYAENRDGLSLSLRIAGATSQDEAFALVQRRQITHIVLASWDPALERLAELNGDQEKKSLVALLHRWLPPRWLRPVPYRMPEVSGFEGQSVVVFEVVELQDDSVALSNLAEYFIETGQTELAASAGAALARLYPDDLGAAVARVEAAAATRDQKAANDAFKVLQNQLAAGAAQSLPWDRRVSLAIVLTEAKQHDQARAQLEQCLAEMDEPRLRSLTTVTLYRCQLLIKAFGLTIPDQRLQALSQSLLPPEMRGKL